MSSKTTSPPCAPPAGAWGYQPNKEPKSLKACVRLLVKVAGRDGNLLLNVGPAPDGRIDPAQAARLREIGDWLGLHGESIRGTRGGPYLLGNYGASTHRGHTIYVHVLDWPGERLCLPALAATVRRASLLTGGELTFTQNENGLEFAVAAGDRREIDTIIALELDRPAVALPLVAVDAP